MAKQTIVWDYVDNSDSPISTLIDTAAEDGESVAVLIAEEMNRHESECFCEGGRITIFSPPEFVGSYEITAFYEPTFCADRVGSIPDCDGEHCDCDDRLDGGLSCQQEVAA